MWFAILVAIVVVLVMLWPYLGNWGADEKIVVVHWQDDAHQDDAHQDKGETQKQQAEAPAVKAKVEMPQDVPAFSTRSATVPIEVATETPASQPVQIKPEPPAKPAKPDNLRRIEGIGPKIASLLNKGGIATFAQLAQTDITRLQEILQAAELHMIDPATWPEQAALAAAGDWDTLDKLQDELKGGKRVS